jgi:Glycosyl transferase family 2
MKLIMTLLVRDEVDIVDAQIAFHLNAGVDFVLALDHGSSDGTTDVLETYAAAGYLRRIPKSGPLREIAWRTGLARLAAVEYVADWVINADADQFWWPRVGTLPEALVAVPARYGLITSFDRVFVPRPYDGLHFAERMTLRLAPNAPINAPQSTYRPLPRVLHRGDPGIEVSRGSHTVTGTRLVPLPGWSPIEVLHFPWRSPEQMTRKANHMWHAFSSGSRAPAEYHAAAERAVRRGAQADHYRGLVVEAEAAERGIVLGLLDRDTRVRDVLRTLAGGPLSPDGASETFVRALSRGSARLHAETGADRQRFEVEAAALREANAVRASRVVDSLAERVRTLETRAARRRAAV